MTLLSHLRVVLVLSLALLRGGGVSAAGGSNTRRELQEGTCPSASDLVACTADLNPVKCGLNSKF
jgi:hypothetical protein